MTSGYVQQEDYYETIDFDFTFGIPIIMVTIQGEEYRFMLDTGAPNVISRELAEKITYKEIAKAKIRDSQGGRKSQMSVLIDKIQIGSVSFFDMGAVLIDYNQVLELSCLEIDGFIGANLMARAKWQIDYEKKEISFTDRKEEFIIPTEAEIIPFKEKVPQRTPMVSAKAGPMKYRGITFDTGASGGLSLMVGSAKKIIDSISTVEIIGSNSVGVYGDGGIGMTQYGVVDTLEIGDLLLYDQVLEFEPKGSMLLGNKILKEYRVVIDWEKDEIYLMKYDQGYDTRTFESMDISAIFRNNQAIIGAIVKGSKAQLAGFELGDQVVQIDEFDLRNVSDDLACELYRSQVVKNRDTVTFTILKEGVEQELRLVKEKLIREKERL